MTHLRHHIIPVLCLLILLIVAGTCCTACCAKEEVVYANLDASGNPEGIYIVNIFDVAASANLTDYGPYTTVKNLVSTDEIIKTQTFPDGDNEYTVTYGPGKLYYQGNPEGLELPWDISFAYELDGKPVSPEELAGSTGHVTITMKITGNPDGDKFFYENYGMTVTILLDANTCLNIIAPEAVIANNGANKQISYTILPNKVTEKTIDCDAIGFHFDAVSINGVRLSMDISTKDVQSEDIDDLKDGVHDLVDVAETLKNGAANLYKFSTYLSQDGGINSSIITYSGTLANGINELLNNLIKLKNEVADIDEKISDQINEVLDPLSSNPESLHSFASMKNSDIERVQFVIQTKAIEVPEEEPVIEPEKELSFFERILAIFGLA